MDALFTKTQQRVLGLLFGQPDRVFGTLELITLAGGGRGSVQRELERLAGSGLVTVTAAGQQRRYQASSSSPLFSELRSIVEKTLGVPGALRRALEPIAASIRLAVLYGSVAKRTDRAASDIDVLVVSDGLHLEDLYTAFERSEQELGRRVSPTLYTSKEFRERRRARHPFLEKVLTGEHVVLLGSEDAPQTAR